MPEDVNKLLADRNSAENHSGPDKYSRTMRKHPFLSVFYLFLMFIITEAL